MKVKYVNIDKLTRFSEEVEVDLEILKKIIIDEALNRKVTILFITSEEYKNIYSSLNGENI